MNEIKIESCTVFTRSTPSFFNVTYMLLQNNCKSNYVTNGLKQKKGKKRAKKPLCGKIKERRETGSEWLIGGHTQTYPTFQQ